MGQRLAPSRMALADLCLYTFRDDVPLPPDKSGPEADAGKRDHAAIELFVRDGEVSEALPKSFLAWWNASGLSHETHTLTAELPIVYDFVRGVSRVVELMPNGRIGKTSTDEMPAILDLVVEPHDPRDAVTIVDWKTGKPKDFVWQMQAYALAYSRLRPSSDSVQALIVYVHEERTWQDLPMVFDAMDLDAAEMAARGMKRRLPLAQPNPGKHCRDLWCRLRETCGARRDWERNNRKAA